VVYVGEKERRYNGREGEGKREEGGRGRMREYESGVRERKRGGLDKEGLSV
jgi:hypothetical protein